MVMALSIQVRNYQESDREACRALWHELTEKHREIYQDPKIGGEHPEDYFDKHLAKVGADNIWVAVHGSEVVGLVGLIVEEAEAEIEPLVVRKGYRAKGVGTRLIEEVVSEARKRKIKFLNVEPVARNVEMIRFMYKLGFRTLGNIQMFMCFSDYVWKEGPELFGCKFNY
jgi:GNAT superfamily N-acetyltransferase